MMNEGQKITAELQRSLPKRSEGDQIMADLLEWASFMAFDHPDNSISVWVRAKDYMNRVRDKENCKENSNAED